MYILEESLTVFFTFHLYTLLWIYIFNKFLLLLLLFSIFFRAISLNKNGHTNSTFGPYIYNRTGILFFKKEMKTKNRTNCVIWKTKLKRIENMIFFYFVCREREGVKIFAINFTILDKLRQNLCHKMKREK